MTANTPTLTYALDVMADRLRDYAAELHEHAKAAGGIGHGAAH